MRDTGSKSSTFFQAAFGDMKKHVVRHGPIKAEATNSAADVLQAGGSNEIRLVDDHTNNPEQTSPSNTQHGSVITDIGPTLDEILSQVELNHEYDIGSAIGLLPEEAQGRVCDKIYDYQIDRWLGFQNLRSQIQFHTGLKGLRANEACEFLVQNDLLKRWYHSASSEQLAVIGDLGSGKTITMSFIVDYLNRESYRQIPQPKLCWYYCRDNETGTVSRILSTLLLSILKQLPVLKKSFVQSYKEAEISGYSAPGADPECLKNFLRDALEATDCPVFIIIDGIDECGEKARDGLLELLKTLSQELPVFKILLSSRSNQAVLSQLDGKPFIQLDSDIHRDRIIAEFTVNSQLSYLPRNVKELIIEGLACRAQGSAIWTKMTTKLIQLYGIDTEESVHFFLENIPLSTELSKLYLKVYSGCTCGEPKIERIASDALKILATAHRDLNLLELSWATFLSTYPHVTTVEEIAELHGMVSVMRLIEPFIAKIDSNDLKRRQVRLNHQSVKDFIMEHWTEFPHPQDSIVTQTKERDLNPRFEGADSFILNICIRYLLLEEIGDRALFSDEQVAILELPQEIDLFDKNDCENYTTDCTWDEWEEGAIRFDPAERGFGEFFVYASCYWIEHLASVRSGYLPGLVSIEKLCQAGSTRLNNWTSQNCRPGCAILARFDFDTRLYDALGIVSLYGSEDMLRYLLANSKFEKGKFLENSVESAVNQVMRWGDLKRLKIILSNDQVSPHLKNADFFEVQAFVSQGHIIQI